ncbi:hypothetical protein, partial [Moorena sp. SIO2C4]
MGFQDYSDWISLWRPIFLMVNIGIAGLIFYHLYNHKLFIFGWFAALLWLLNRWTLYVSIDANLDFLAIFFMILSLMLLPKHKSKAFLMFSLSLGIKQIAIFLVPLYLIWAWQSSEDNPVKDTFIALLLILVIPGITSLPFILWNAEGFFKSILFSATRNPDGHVNAPSLDGLITLSNPDFIGIKAKLPMVLVMSLVFLSAMKRQIGIYTSALLRGCLKSLICYIQAPVGPPILG